MVNEPSGRTIRGAGFRREETLILADELAFICGKWADLIVSLCVLLARLWEVEHRKLCAILRHGPEFLDAIHASLVCTFMCALKIGTNPTSGPLVIRIQSEDQSEGDDHRRSHTSADAAGAAKGEIRNGPSNCHSARGGCGRDHRLPRPRDRLGDLTARLPGGGWL